jgi:predicted nucleotidyltransferase
MVKTKDEVIKIVQKFLDRIKSKYQIHSAYIFGSYVKGNSKEYSDIDLCIVLDKITKHDILYDESFEIFHEAQKFNSMLEVLCVEKKDFESNSEFIFSQIKKEGIRVV